MEKRPHLLVSKKHDYKIPNIPILEEKVKISDQMDWLIKYKKLPKLLEDDSWTQAVPYKNWFDYVKPMENIGFAFRNRAMKYRLKSTLLKPPQVVTEQPRRLLLDYPPIVPNEDNTITNLSSVFCENYSNIIDLQDLSDGSWTARKSKRKHNEAVHSSREKRKRINEKLSEEQVIYNILFILLTKS